MGENEIGRKEILAAARRVRQRIVRRYGVMQPVCQIAAFEVTSELLGMGIQAETIRGAYIPRCGDIDLCPHYWTEADGYIVDVTLDQLGFGPDRPQIRVRRTRGGGRGSYLTESEYMTLMAFEYAS